MKLNNMRSPETEKIEVGLEQNTYPIFIGQGTLIDLGEALKTVSFPRKVAIVSNELVFSLYGEVVQSTLTEAGYSVTTILIGDGEEYKTLATLSSVYDQLIVNDMDRGCGIIALGGGVVGDLAGYAASSYMRGIACVQVPTTLLAQVDSSVGGKTAVNHPQGKNIIGAFYQPKLVSIDVNVLNTLAEREYLAGFAEVIKYGVIRDGDFFNWLVENSEQLLKRNPETLKHAIKTSCQIKADIVEIDEKESGIRAILNFGHTFGHAVETITGYSRFLHGEAVSIGMVVAARIAEQEGLCSKQDVSAVTSLLQRFKLPVTPPSFSIETYIESMMHDKKVKDGLLRMVLNRGIGQCEIVDVASLLTVLKPVLETGNRSNND